MAEPFFGSPPQLWPATPAPMFGYVQAPLPPLARSLGFGSPALAMSAPFANGPIAGAALPNATPDAYGHVMPNLNGPNFGAGLPAVLSTPVAGLPLAGSEIAVGVTAPALLAAVAMRRGQPLGPANDQEIEDFISDALDLLPGANDVEVRCEGGRATLTGSVPHKRLKRDASEIAWTIPSVADVQNNVTIATRRRSRGPGREGEAPVVSGRKQP